MKPKDKIEEEVLKDVEVCGYCKKEYVFSYWIETEECKHCGKFLDNPPYTKRIKQGGIE